MCIPESQSKKIRSVQKCPSSKAGNRLVHPEGGDQCWTGGAYERAREHGKGARTPLAALRPDSGQAFSHSLYCRVIFPFAIMSYYRLILYSVLKGPQWPA
jgi:hypothetical protein